MKLLYCETCGDIFNLTGERVKVCHCGKVKGVYINHSEAITNGQGYSLAIGNGSFTNALYRMITLFVKKPETDRGGYIDKCKIEYSWWRPNEGEGNPHTFIANDDDERWDDIDE